MFKFRCNANIIGAILLCNIVLTGCAEVQNQNSVETSETTLKVDYTTIVTEMEDEEEGIALQANIEDDNVEEIVQTDENGEESRVMLSIMPDEEPTDGGVNVAAVEVVDDSENALKETIAEVSGKDVLQSFYGDYNKNKGFELFAVVSNEDGQSQDLWFTNGTVTFEVEQGVVSGKDKDQYKQGTYNENGQTFDYVMVTEPVMGTNVEAVKSLYTFDDVLYDLAGEYGTRVYDKYLLCTLDERFYIMSPVDNSYILYPCVWEPSAHRFRLNTYEYLDKDAVTFSEDVDLQQHIQDIIKWENGVYTINFVEEFKSYRSKSYIINAEGECQFLSTDNSADLVYGYYPETMLIEPIS